MTQPDRSKKALLLALLELSGAIRLARWRRRADALVLTYHGVLPADAIVDRYLCRSVVEVRAFEWQMRFLARHYICLPLIELVKRLESGQALPRHVAAVTFDDGFENNWSVAWPVLRRQGIPATIFLVTGLIGRAPVMMWTDKVAWLVRSTPSTRLAVTLGADRLELALTDGPSRERGARRVLAAMKSLDANARATAMAALEASIDQPLTSPPPSRYRFLDWPQVREMHQAGVTFGSHTVTHPVLSTVPDADSRQELEASKATIETELGVPCELFAYPNGTPADFGEREKRLLGDLGYRAAVTQIPGHNSPGVDRFEMRRMHIGLDVTDRLFRAQTSGVWHALRRLVPQTAGVA